MPIRSAPRFPCGVRLKLPAPRSGPSLAAGRPERRRSIGKEMHEEPPVPNYGKRGSGVLIKDGMCIAIEPMITAGSPRIGIMPDRWTVKTLDGKCAAHFEHTVAVHHGKADILSSFAGIEEVEGKLY